MKTCSIQNYYTNPGRKPLFKGKVSNDFIEYVNVIRHDCLNTTPKQFSNLINNSCDNIINKAQRVMQNCFPPTSILSIDTTKYAEIDVITHTNSVIQKHISGMVYNAYYAIKDSTPVHKLRRLQEAVILGYAFAGASVKDYVAIFYKADYLRGANLHDKQFSKDCTELLEFYRDKIPLLKSETNADKHCKLRNQADYEELLTDLKSLCE